MTVSPPATPAINRISNWLLIELPCQDVPTRSSPLPPPRPGQGHKPPRRRDDHPPATVSGVFSTAIELIRLKSSVLRTVPLPWPLFRQSSGPAPKDEGGREGSLTQPKSEKSGAKQLTAPERDSMGTFMLEMDFP